MKFKETLLKYSMFLLSVGTTMGPYSVFIEQKAKTLMVQQKELELYYKKYHLK